MAVAEKTKEKTVAAMERVFRAARELVQAERELRAEATGSAPTTQRPRLLLAIEEDAHVT